VVKNLAPDTVPRGYWTNTGVVLNVVIATIAVLLVMHLLWSTP
jgi:hypothetical protein